MSIVRDQPPNQFFDSALDVWTSFSQPAYYTSDIPIKSEESVLPSPVAYHTIWYRVHSLANGTLTVTVTSSGLDGLVTIYSGVSLSTLVVVSSGTGTATLAVNKGDAFYVRVGVASPATAVLLAVAITLPAPPTDLFPITIVREGQLRVVVDDVDVPNPVSASWHYSLTNDVASASVVVTSAVGFYLGGTLGPSAPITGWSRIQVYAGCTPGHGLVKRFDGYIIGIGRTGYPGRVTLQCGGRLQKAVRITNPDRRHIVGISGEIDQQGTDLSSMVDIDAVAYALTKVDLGLAFSTGVSGSLGGLNRAFGVGDSGILVWPFGQDAMSFIKMIDAVCLGFRTYDTPGLIVRAQITPRANQAAAPAAIFTENVDIERVEDNDDWLAGANEYIVTGTDHGVSGTAVKWGVHQRSIYLPGAISYTRQTFDSGLIEHQSLADRIAAGGYGVSTQEVSEDLLARNNCLFIKLTMNTLRDDDIAIGQTIQINAFTRIGFSQKVFVQDVSGEINENRQFHQAFEVLDTLPSLGAVTYFNPDTPNTFLRNGIDASQITIDVGSYIQEGFDEQTPPFTVEIGNTKDNSLEYLRIDSVGSAPHLTWTVTRNIDPDADHSAKSHVAGEPITLVDPKLAPITPATFPSSSTNAKAYALAPGELFDAYTATPQFDHSTWPGAVVAITDGSPPDGIFPVAGTEPLWSDVTPLASQYIVLRQWFAIPEGTLAAATLTISAPSTCAFEQIYINGTEILTGGVIPGQVLVIPFDPVSNDIGPTLGRLVPGVPNLIAVLLYNSGDGLAGNYAWCSFKIEVA